MKIDWNYVYVWVIIALSILAAVGIYFNGTKALYTLLVAVATATVLDLVIKKIKKESLAFPYSAVISGLIVGSIVSFEDSLLIPLVAAIIAILSKHVIRFKAYHPLNPATFGLLASFLLFSKFDSWWASVPYLIPFLLIISWKIRKLWISFTFLIAFAALVYFTGNIRLQSFTDFLSLPYYFTFIMVTEPKTTPSVRNQQIVFGISLAVLLFLLTFVFKLPYAIFISLLLMNLGYFVYRIRS